MLTTPTDSSAFRLQICVFLMIVKTFIFLHSVHRLLFVTKANHSLWGTYWFCIYNDSRRWHWDMFFSEYWSFPCQYNSTVYPYSSSLTTLTRRTSGQSLRTSKKQDSFGNRGSTFTLLVALLMPPIRQHVPLSSHHLVVPRLGMSQIILLIVYTPTLLPDPRAPMPCHYCGVTQTSLAIPRRRFRWLLLPQQ